ncbi:MAG: TIGR04053 family radical SAM/SPASM domain-containing protein [Armatimonadota bacterium]|nr:TIGR04053 family radical SAM/SPASM domain-containing protein [Armatimonadota bacterium]MDR7422067.1 TIGR04053 family radical SAM/SPASM domain-containing protein [Armatimonadota bacterium]MDR7454131.1 TIGR04053 family radical SAM/SPASM domain-containing protein [Armatimonadota bacterium]MDR7456230.1 TIGR04053 family radical SAM/SPASM domain-containing protein [Armatimonadota bacterium]MDR7496902.1 TIGR04053 family radical SAM/SPASM domain-containing protein [Armatimonadota bacterium]
MTEPQAPPAGPAGRPSYHAVREAQTGYVYDRAPMLVYWELTRACDLACHHCRAEAISHRDPDELTFDEATDVLQQVVEFGPPLPHLVFTGGDPLKRGDLEALVREAARLGIGASLAPAATPLLRREAIVRLRDAGIQSISLSLDGSCPDQHDAFRGVPGCFDQTVRAVNWVAEAGLPLQINTLVTDRTVADLPAIYRLLTAWPVERWSLFFLIAVGRGQALRELDPASAERLMDWLYDLAADSPFAIKTTEAPHYRRVAVERMRAAGWDGARIRRSSVGRGFGIRDGNGILFISRTGDVTPSGFLPMAAGNVRRARLVDLYRSSALFTALRDPSRFAGRCGRCEYHTICGGSRARAFAHTGDPLASDPLCPYVPA